MNPFHREPYEERQYPVSGRNLRGHKGAFERAGYPVQVTPTGAPGIYIIVVNLPASMPQEIDPYSLPPRRQAWPRFDPVAALRSVAVIAIAAVVVWFAWQMFAPAQPDTAADVAAAPSWRWPWQDGAANGEPVVELLPADGWRLPWDAAADAAQSVQATVTTVSAVILAALVLLIILALLRRRR